MALLPYEHLEREVLEMALRSDNPEEGNPTSMWLLQEKLQLWLEASDGREITACLRRLHESKQIEVWKLENNTWIKFLPGFKDDDFFYTLLFYIRPTKFTSPHLQKLNAKNDKNEVMTDQLKAQSTVKPVNSPVRKVFVVHGHDDGARESVARFLERANFEAIILHEQANSGRTIIEKLQTTKGVSAAKVLSRVPGRTWFWNWDIFSVASAAVVSALSRSAKILKFPLISEESSTYLSTLAVDGNRLLEKNSNRLDSQSIGRSSWVADHDQPNCSSQNTPALLPNALFSVSFEIKRKLEDCAPDWHIDNQLVVVLFLFREPDGTR
jgi:hypothetical protein